MEFTSQPDVEEVCGMSNTRSPLCSTWNERIGDYE